MRNLVELQGGGAVHVESAGPGRGATFTVTLAITSERLAGEADAVGVVARALASGRLPSLNGVRVLVVDDEPDARELMRAILAQCVAEVTVAATARLALEALETAPFDVLVSDIAMPEEDGYDLIRNVRALDAGRGGRIPALALTAYARIEDRAAAIAAGYQQFATSRSNRPSRIRSSTPVKCGGVQLLRREQGWRARTTWSTQTAISSSRSTCGTGTSIPSSASAGRGLSSTTTARNA